MSKAIIVTGATGNLGTAVVDQLSGEGYFIEATVRNSVPDSFNKSNINTFSLNLLDEKATHDYTIERIKKHKNIDAAVLLVGGFISGGLAETDGQAIDKMIALNFKSAYHIVRPLLEQFEKQPDGGQIILIGSRSVLNAESAKNNVAYTLSKSLIFQLAELINAQEKDRKITASVIIPSIIDTPVNRAALPNADYSKWVQAEEIASIISFVLSDSGNQLREPILKIYGEV